MLMVQVMIGSGNCLKHILVVSSKERRLGIKNKSTDSGGEVNHSTFIDGIKAAKLPVPQPVAG